MVTVTYRVQHVDSALYPTFSRHSEQVFRALNLHRYHWAVHPWRCTWFTVHHSVTDGHVPGNGGEILELPGVPVSVPSV